MKVNNVELDFDLTSPEDMRRYRAAGEKMAAAADALPPQPADTTTPIGFDAYIAWLEQYCHILTEFLDEAFGPGTCNALLGPKTSLARLLDVCDAIGTAVGEQGSAMGARIKSYMPNRATRRGKGLKP